MNNPRIEYVKGPSFASSYCNNIAYAVNLIDFVLIFGEAIDATPDVVTVEQRARITMSPVQAKVLSAILTDQIANYEARSGKVLEIPEGMIQPANQE